MSTPVIVMSRSPFGGRFAVGLLAMFVGAGAFGCETPTINPPDAVNLDRPVDVAFGCYGGLRITGGGPADATQPTVVSGMPIGACDIRAGSGDDVPPGQERVAGAAALAAVNYYAFIVQSVPGTLAVSRFETKPAEGFTGSDIVVLDSDPLTPGKNGISVGSLPVAVATDQAGCHVVTANAGSCDLSVLDINSTLKNNPDPIVQRLGVTNASNQPILARPEAMIAGPGSATIGKACPAAPEGVFYVAYPACNLVATVDGSGRIVAGVRFLADGTATITDGNVSCPAQCGVAQPPSAGPRPVTLDLMDDTRIGRRRLAIGAENSNRITVVELDANSRPMAVEQIVLADPEGDLGITDVALTPQIGLGGVTGQLNDQFGVGGQAQFIYAVATDRSVRVAEVLDIDRECDTQIDPRYVRDINSVRTLSCMPLGDPARPRRARALGPGIQLPGQGAPLAVTTFAVDRPELAQPGTDPLRLAGHYAAITSTTGLVYLANIDDDSYWDLENQEAPLQVDLSLAMSHQLRDKTPGRDGLAERDGAFICQTDGPAPPDASNEFRDSGGPRAAQTPSRSLDEAAIAPGKASSLPGLRGVLCEGTDGQRAVSELSFAAPVAIREATFPDWGSLDADENWRIEWEGRLSADGSQVIDGPQIRTGLVKVGGTGMRVVDGTRPYCAAGVEDHDQVILRGCDPAQGGVDCPIGTTCYVHPESQIGAGSCLPTEQVDFLSQPCRDFLLSRRVYSVRESTAGELRLMERPRVLRTSPVDGCTSTAQCDELADVAARLTSASHPFEDQTMATDRMWSCEAEPSRGGPNRCVMRCQTTADCLAGDVCNGSGTCVMGPIPPLQCVTGAQRYELRASDAFVVIGGRTGYVHSVVEDENAGGRCQRSTTPHPLDVGRIPLVLPPCTGVGPTDLSPNPCSLTVSNVERRVRYLPGTCTPADPADELVTRDAAALRFRNRSFSLTLVDPTYPGDAMCRGDRGGTLVGVPTVYPGMNLQFRQVGGFSVMTVPEVSSTMPVRATRGPTGSVWVVDEGDHLLGNAGASSRGRVYRFEGININRVNTVR